MEELHSCMAADETFSSVEALQDAIAKDVEQRIATAHMRPPPSKPAAARGASVLNNAPGNTLAKIMEPTSDSKHAQGVRWPRHTKSAYDKRIWPRQTQVCLLKSLHKANVTWSLCVRLHHYCGLYAFATAITNK